MFNPLMRFFMAFISVFSLSCILIPQAHAGATAVAWTDNTPGNREIYCAVTPDNGGTWTIKRLTNNAGASYGPSISTGTTGTP